jgi:hypothetical protein
MPAEKDSMRKAMDVIDEPAGPGEMDDEGLGAGAAGAGIGYLAGGPLGAIVGGGLGGSMEDEGIKGAALGGVGGAMLGGPMGALTGAAAGSTVGDAIDDEGMGSGNSEMSSMADEIRSMADRLSKIEDLDELPGVEGGEEKADEAWDNSPADPTNVPLGNTNDFAYNPNAASGGVNKGMTNMPSAMAEDLESQLFADYKNFVSESKKKADVKENLHHHAGPKIDQKDVHRVVDCAYSSGVPLMHEDSGCVMDCMSSYPKEHARLTNKYNECWEEFHNKCCDHYHSKNKMGEQLSSTGVAGVGVLPEGKKTMSQAAKGNEKYGKAGMQALAKAGREGKSLKPVKAKYNKYN